ncbi:hypothetical protein CRG98_045216 [Punica granatum]|uniref:Uncharacterized protein n=1 Tax=Punica granatum TaxID=22663 RepID=A0A2I0HRQ0_PUNGR|nr:hypothetical protein CRG98_045216 [Punica granatum]
MRQSRVRQGGDAPWGSMPYRRAKLCLGRCLESAESSDADVAIGAFGRLAGVALLKRVFALAMRMGSRFRRPQCEASKASVGHARAYQEILNDSLAALSVIRRARRLSTLLVGYLWAAAFVTRTGDFCANLDTRVHIRREMYPLFSFVLSCRLSRTVLMARSVAHCARGRARFGRLSLVGEPIGDPIGVDNLTISLRDSWSAQSVTVSFARVAHYDDLRANFNQGDPSARRLPRLCCRELQPGMPQCTSLGNAHLGRMMSEVVLWAPCAIIVLDRACGSSISCTLDMCALEAGGTSLSGPSLLKYRKKDPIGVLRESLRKSACYRGGWLMAIAEGRVGPFSGQKYDRANDSRGGWAGPYSRRGRVGPLCLEFKEVAEKCFLSRLWSFGIQIAFLSVISCNGKRGAMKEKTMFAISTQGRRGSN